MTSGTRSADEWDTENLRRLLAGMRVIGSACDLDLLVFLYRHPRSMLTNEQLASLVGYEMKQVAASIEALVEAGLLHRTQHPLHAARMYLLIIDGPRGKALRSLLQIASTRQGRLSIVALLDSRQPKASIQKLRAIV